MSSWDSWNDGDFGGADERPRQSGGGAHVARSGNRQSIPRVDDTNGVSRGGAHVKKPAQQQPRESFADAVPAVRSAAGDGGLYGRTASDSTTNLHTPNQMTGYVSGYGGIDDASARGRARNAANPNATTVMQPGGSDGAGNAYSRNAASYTASNGDGGSHGRGKGGKGGKSEKPKRPWDWKSKTLLIVGIALLVAALIVVGVIVKGYLDARAEYDRARLDAGIDTSLFDKALGGEMNLTDLNVDWDALKAENPDVVAWVYIQGTDINYPVVQADDNDYYLTHSYTKASSSSGSIFLDCDNNANLTDMHNVLYGHNMLDGSMFAQILNFKDQDFLDNGYKILILTPSYAYVLQPAFTYICDGAEELRQLGFTTKTQLQTYITELMGHAVTESTVDTTKIDKLFSLVTCSYEGDDVRTVLCCVQTDAVTFPNGA